MFENESSNNAISKSMKALVKRKARFTMNKSSNRPNKCCENLGNETRHKLSKTAKKRMKSIHESLDDEASKKLR